MRNKVLVALLMFGLTMAAMGQVGLELNGGLVVDKDVLVFNTYFPENWSFKSLNVGLNFQLHDWFGLGIYSGYLHNSPYIKQAQKDGIYPLALPINLGIKVFLGKIIDGFAGYMNLGIIPGIGLVYKNFIMDFGYGYFVDVNKIHIDQNGATSIVQSFEFYPYIGIGYIIPFS